MRILIVGVSGFIGSAVAARLHARGDEVVGVARGTSRLAAVSRLVSLDLADATAPAAWRPHLAGIDAVLYCAGTLQAARPETLDAIHHRTPAALYEACAEAGVRRVVHLSALGAERAASPFSATKRAGDAALMALDLDWTVLRPSVVLGPAAYGGSALLRALAALPVSPLPRDAGRLRPVLLDDLVDTILFFLRADAPAKQVLEVVGPRAFALPELVAMLRGWLGVKRDRVVTMPRWLSAAGFRAGDLLARLGWETAMRSTAARELLQVAEGDPLPWQRATGLTARPLEAAFAPGMAPVQEKWFARLYLLRPFLFVVTAFFWMATGFVALGPGWDYGMGLMAEGGVHGATAGAVIVAGALCDIAIGLAIARRRTARLGLLAALLVTITYAIVGTLLVPRLWSDPMGPMLKVLPILMLHLAALAIVEER